MHRPTYISSIVSILTLLLAGAACDVNQNTDAALNLRTGGFVDTDFDLSQIVGKQHSITFRVMLQYPNSYVNNIVGESETGAYAVSKDNAIPGPNPCTAALAVNMGGEGTTYSNIEDLADGFIPFRWYHIAVTVDGGLLLRLYVNGILALREDAPFQTTLQLDSSTWATGVLRFGRRNGGVNPPQQFYGLLDDVAVWDHALSEAEVKTLTGGYKLNGNESGLLAGWNFDIPFAGNYPPKHNGVLTYNGEADQVWPLTGNDSEDAGKILPTKHNTAFSLPVKGNWLINQGVDSGCGGSHRGYASFCVDMYYADGETTGQPIYAAADGTVILVRDTSPQDVSNQEVAGCAECNDGDNSCRYISNEVLIQHTSTEFTSYLHLSPGSVPQAIREKLRSGDRVSRGEKIGEAGRSGTASPHLHFAMLWTVTLPANVGIIPGVDIPNMGCGYMPAVPDSTPLVTRPFQFSNYWAKPEGASAFEHISHATPRLGDMIRDTEP